MQRFQICFGVFDVQVLKNMPVKLGRIRAGTNVKDELNFLIILIEPVKKAFPFTRSCMRLPVKFFSFSGCVKSSTAMIKLKFSRFSFSIRQLPMKPAAPVTMIINWWSKRVS
jgi:hypothetical protein